MTDRRGPGLILIHCQQLCISCLSDYLSVGLTEVLSSMTINPFTISLCIVRSSLLSNCLSVCLSACPLFVHHSYPHPLNQRHQAKPSLCCCIYIHAAPCMFLTMHRYMSSCINPICPLSLHSLLFFILRHSCQDKPIKNSGALPAKSLASERRKKNGT